MLIWMLILQIEQITEFNQLSNPNSLFVGGWSMPYILLEIVVDVSELFICLCFDEKKRSGSLNKFKFQPWAKMYDLIFLGFQQLE